MAFLDVTNIGTLCNIIDFLRSEFDICSSIEENRINDKSYDMGPDASFFQMTQGLLLEIDNKTCAARRLYTRYGQWTIIHGASSGFFKKVFNVVKKQLHLKKFKDFPEEGTSLWAIKSWKGQAIEEPIMASPIERFSEEYVDKTYIEFLSSLKV
jgi:hypothetical protein